ncbi:hypothetical protein N3K66_004334 [Trichothecium roseum]|uniref:Uncharacterized protein n=1 Tax=Trichothecium roseum TaxID=47278 RepID=A0ACC0V1I0_9HYPO|nr:hypothetical protein N3K66_004334 [Trichothecium roseum]
MSFRLAARRLGQPASSHLRGVLFPSPLPRAALGPSSTQQYRYKWSLFSGFRNRKGSSAGAGGSGGGQKLEPGSAGLADPATRKDYIKAQKTARQPQGTEGSIFEDEIPSEVRDDQSREERESGMRPVEKTRENMAYVVDPNPRARIRWQRKKVMQMVRGNGQLSREERIKMTERELTFKSHWMPTSLKKLVMLSRQIAGKTVDEAITQMKWSKKKMGAEVKYVLEEARDLAIASRGMGLGQVNGETLSQPKKIRTDDGRWLEITDPTRLYVAQSWIGRGAWRGKRVDYKGRARMGIILHPSTCLTVVLKEEKTRIREYEERVAKDLEKGPWVHLPNRKVNHQRPYYSW